MYPKDYFINFRGNYPFLSFKKFPSYSQCLARLNVMLTFALSHTHPASGKFLRRAKVAPRKWKIKDIFTKFNLCVCAPSMANQLKENLSLSSGFPQIQKKRCSRRRGQKSKSPRHKVWWFCYKNSNYRDVTLRRVVWFKADQFRTGHTANWLIWAHHSSFLPTRTTWVCERRALSLDGTLRVKMMIILGREP